MFIFKNAAVYELRIFCKQGPQTAINVRHFRSEFTTAVNPQITTTIFLGLIGPTLASAYSGVLNESAEFRGLAIQEVDPVPNGPLDFFSDVRPGVIAGDPLPSQTCGLIAFATSGNGGINKSSAYIPFPSETANDGGGNPSNPYKDDLGLIGDALTVSYVMPNGVDALRMVPVAYRRAGSITAVVTGYRRRQFWATQRSRGAFGKHNSSPV